MEGSESYRKIVEAAEEYMRDRGHIGANKSISSNDLIAALKQKIASGDLQVQISDNTIYQYFSKAASDESTNVVSGGAWRGYWLQEHIEQPEEKIEFEKTISTEEGAELKFKESDLYPLVELWMSSKYDASHDVSALKGGGKWGNPDVVGVSRLELLGAVELEIGSCEVKLSDSSWELYVFEAVSHKRFANRSWYCYRTSSNTPNPKGMDVYAERFKIGVLQIVLDDNQLAELKKSGNRLGFIDSVREIIPAPYEATSLAEKKAFIDRVGFALKVAKAE